MFDRHHHHHGGGVSHRCRAQGTRGIMTKTIFVRANSLDLNAGAHDTEYQYPPAKWERVTIPTIEESIWGDDDTANYVHISCGNRRCPVSVQLLQQPDGRSASAQSLMRRAARKWNKRAPKGDK